MSKKPTKPTKKRPTPDAYIENAGLVETQEITSTLRENYMPYAMSVILSRALPQIDGFKPSHRKLLYTMFKMGLLSGPRTKSANIVGQTMRLNPHGDGPIYETMVRLARGNEALLHPFVDSKGNFGKAYSRDMAYAASRYTEAKLDKVCEAVFTDIDKNTVEFIPNYDNTTTEPLLLPVKFPAILVNSNIGIAVSMASNICPFNLGEVCKAAIKLIEHPNASISDIIRAPDFPGGGQILYNAEEMDKIYKTGRGSVKVRSKYTIVNGVIEITEIPPTTTVEAITDKIVDLVKVGKIKEISDIRDETDLSGLKIAIDLKRGVDGDALMKKLFAMTTLQDSFSCNFNLLIGFTPMVLGVYDILKQWTDWRAECVRRRIEFDLKKKKDKLHLLKGLGKILLDIDKAIKIVRETEIEAEVVPNLMIGFGIDQIQAEYVAEIRLRQLNREYILKRISETSDLEKDIAALIELLSNERSVREVIAEELKEVAAKYGSDRKSEIIYDVEDTYQATEEEIPDYPVHLFVTAEGYLKKITPNSLRNSGEHKLKEGDEIAWTIETTNNTDILVFTDNATVYKANLSDFPDGKVAQMGEFLPAKLGFEDGENYHTAIPLGGGYKGELLFFYANGKAAKVPVLAYETKTRRKKLTAAYSNKSPLIAVYHITESVSEYVLRSTSGRTLLFSPAQINAKDTRSTQGVAVQTQNKGATLKSALPYTPDSLENEHRYRTKTVPAKGATEAVQLSLI